MVNGRRHTTLAIYGHAARGRLRKYDTICPTGRARTVWVYYLEVGAHCSIDFCAGKNNADA